MTVRDEIREPLERTLAWQLRFRDGEGRIVCPKHKVEHTGKSACAAITAVELWRLTGREEHLAVAVQQGRRLVANLVREGTSPCHTFRPGRHDPYNCSNSVIDGGACSDALAHLVTTCGERLAPEDARAFADASLLHARTYLRYAVLDKGIPAQRAWGLTGLAGALALERDDALDKALVGAVARLEEIQNGDGSFPYHPLDWGAEHAGASDVSAFYQSRVTGFVLYALERSGRDPAEGVFRAPLLRGLDFLLALQGPDGVKTGLVEAKPWYWGASYEVASHPFDVYAFARGWRLFRNPRYAHAAADAFRAWVRHLTDQGEPRSHFAGPGRGPSYQCPLFWAAHACWIARAAEDLEAIFAEEPPRPIRLETAAIDLRVTWFPHAALGRLEDGAVVAWVRGARPGCNVHHGSPHGAGLIRVVRKEDGAELIQRCPLGGANECEWRGASGLPSLARGLRSGGREVRFGLWLARVERRAGHTGAALRAPLGVFRRGVLAFGHPRVGSAFDLAPEAQVENDGLRLAGRLAWRDGTPVPESKVERGYRVQGDGLEVTDVLASPGRARRVDYVIPAAARDVQREGNRVSYRLA